MYRRNGVCHRVYSKFDRFQVPTRVKKRKTYFDRCVKNNNNISYNSQYRRRKLLYASSRVGNKLKHVILTSGT